MVNRINLVSHFSSNGLGWNVNNCLAQKNAQPGKSLKKEMRKQDNSQDNETEEEDVTDSAILLV